MDLGSIFLILALLVLVGIYVSRPIVEGQSSQAISTNQDGDSDYDHQVSFLLAERDRILMALQELDFDSALGKIPEEDYPDQRDTLLQEGASVLRALDEFSGEAQPNDIEARMEAAIAARRADAGRKPPTAVRADDDLEVLLATRRRDRKEKASGFCPQCGGPIQKSDRFCPKCGADIGAIPAS